MAIVQQLSLCDRVVAAVARAGAIGLPVSAIVTSVEGRSCAVRTAVVRLRQRQILERVQWPTKKCGFYRCVPSTPSLACLSHDRNDDVISKIMTEIEVFRHQQKTLRSRIANLQYAPPQFLLDEFATAVRGEVLLEHSLRVLASRPYSDP